MDLSRVDLNLLVSLDALLTEHNVTRAAARVGLSQPGMSSALARLRKMFDDPLLVREGTRLVPTTTALALAGPLRHALECVEQAIDQRPRFDPATDVAHVRIACADYGALTVLGPLIRDLGRSAPGVTVEAVPRREDPLAVLRSKEADLVIEPVESAPDPLMPFLRLFSDRWMGCMWRGDPRASGDLSTEEFARMGHVVSATSSTGPDELIDRDLRSLGIVRDVRLRVDSFLLAPYLSQGTGLVSLVLERVAPVIMGMADVRLFELPIELPRVTHALWWNESRSSDPVLSWIRQTVLRTCRSPMHDFITSPVGRVMHG